MENQEGSQGYTEKYRELLSFLDKASSDLAEETGETQRGLRDISNHQHSEKNPVAAKSSVEKTAAATTGKRDKYIWDIYDEESENTVVKLEDNDVGPTSDDGVPTGQKRAPAVLPGDARRQLSELKIAAETIAKQFAGMKSELEEKRRVVEELHRDRLLAEKSHVEAFKTAKQLHATKFDDAKRRFGEVSSTDTYLNMLPKVPLAILLTWIHRTKDGT